MEWMKQSDHLNIHTYTVVMTRKKSGRWEYYESASGLGDWAELVYVLYEDYGQFKEDVELAKNKHDALDSLAEKLAKHDQPYEFKLSDGTDNWYYAYSKPVVYRVDHEGKIG